MEKFTSETSTSSVQQQSRQFKIPLPIQSFLWRQTEPFLRKKIGRLYEAACVSFEHVLVENKLQSLAPSLSGAIEAISRWQLIDACIPHILHCAALFLTNRNKFGQADKLGVPATKLLHTLHWIFVDAAEVCKNDRPLDGSAEPSISLENIRLFIYLLAPICNEIKESDLTFRLTSGQQIWRSIWNHEQPDIPAFSSRVNGSELFPSNSQSEGGTQSASECSMTMGHVTVCDVAVISCLLHQSWSEEGVLWGTIYILRKIQKSFKRENDVTTVRSHPRKWQSMIDRRPRSRRKRRTLELIVPQKDVIKEESSDLSNEEQTPGTSATAQVNEDSGKSSNKFFSRFRSKDSKTSSLRLSQGSPITRRKHYSVIERRASTILYRMALREKYMANQPPSYEEVYPLRKRKYGSMKEKNRKSSDDLSVTFKLSNPAVNADSLLPPTYKAAKKRSAPCIASKPMLDELKKKMCTPEIFKEETENTVTIEMSENRRWTSDTCLDKSVYKSEAKSHENYVDERGCLKVDVVLKVIDVIVGKNPGLKVTDVCVHIIDCLHHLKLISNQENPHTVEIYLKILQRLTNILGCSGTCSKAGQISSTSDRMRSLTRLMLTSVFSTHLDQFKSFISEFVGKHSLDKVMEFLHPLLSFCSVDVNNSDVRDVTDEILCADAKATTFIGDVVTKLIFHQVIMKCLEFKKDLYNKTNKVLYEEVRNFIQFVRVKHPSTFNKVLLSIMKTPMKKRKQWMNDQTNKKSEKEEEKQRKISDSNFPKCLRTVRRGAVNLESSPLMSRYSAPVWKQSRFLRKSVEILDVGSLADGESGNTSAVISEGSSPCEYSSSLRSGMEIQRSSSVFGKINIGGLFKKSVSKAYSTGTGLLDEGSSVDSESFLARMRKRTTGKRQNKENAKGFIASKLSMLNKLDSDETNEQENTEFEINTKDISEGLEIMGLLMDFCPPGTCPEPTILGSVMGLESPVLSRAAVLLFCASFVNNCAMGVWPTWVQCKGGNRRSNKNAVIYSNAATLFYRWGVEISNYLERIISLDNNPSEVLGEVRKDEDKLKNRRDDILENFIKDVRVNPNGKDCPGCIKMCASNLLYQITTFLRDVYPRLPQHDGHAAKKGSVPDISVTTPATPKVDSPKKSDLKSSSNPESHLSFAKPPDLQIKEEVESSETFPRPRRCSSIISPLLNPASRSNLAYTSSSTSSGNMLAVPASNPSATSSFSPFSSCSAFSFGSTLSIGSFDSAMQRDVSATPLCSVGTSSAVYFTPHQKSGANAFADHLPWLKHMLALANQQNFLCDHSVFCHPYCHKRMDRSCSRLISTIYSCIIINQHGSFEDNETEKYKSGSFLRYLKFKRSCLTKSALSCLLKSITIIDENMIMDIQALCWEILLDGNKFTSESAGALFLLCAVKIPKEVHSTILTEISHINPSQRITAMEKIRVLWKCRNSVWKLAENRARRAFKVQAPTFSLTFSQSALGLATPNFPEPPWLPNIVNIDDILAQSSFSNAGNAAFLATDTLSHYKEDRLKKLLALDEEQRAKARNKFHVTNVSLIQIATTEVRRKVAVEENDEDCSEVGDRFSRFTSVSSSTYLANKANSRTHSSEIMSQDNVSKYTELPNFPVFPSCISVCVSSIINLLSDDAVSGNNSVSEMAGTVLRECLNEDQNLFLRSLTDQLTNKQDQEYSIRLIRTLTNLLNQMSPAVAHSLINHLIEAVLQYSRGQDSNEAYISPCVAAITSVLPFAQAIDLKTVKQALRKEQIETQILASSGMPGTKKLTVWNQGDYYMPTQVDVTDDSNFELVLREAITSLGVTEHSHEFYQLIDLRTSQILCRHCYVRDFYQFKKSVYPELTLVKMEPSESYKLVIARVIDLKLAEIQKIKVSISALRNQTSAVEKELNATFVQDELKKLWCFPRKAMDAEFFLFGTKHGEEIKSIDAMLKYYWIDFIVTTLLSLSKEFPWANDLKYFLHVLSASLVVHCENVTILRKFSASVIDIMVYFSHTFTMHGYKFILPPMLRVYSKHYENKVVRKSLEFVFKQMQNVHRQPFLLLLFASAAPLLSAYKHMQESGELSSEDQLSHQHFFQLLLSLQSNVECDEIDVMSLVAADKPFKVADVCAEGDDFVKTFGNNFRLCITVIAYHPENHRTLELLIVMNSILPCYLDHIRQQYTPVEEIYKLNEMSVCIRSLLANVEVLARVVQSTISQQQQQHQTSARVSLAKAHAESAMEEGGVRAGGEGEEKKQQTAEEFIAPRDQVLQICTEFYTRFNARMKAIKGTITEDCFNTKSHIRIAEVAQSLLKLLTDDAIPVISIGMVSYIKHMLPMVDWSVENNRPALFLVLKRLDKFFAKANKVYIYRMNLDCRMMAMIVDGLCDLLSRQPAVAHIPHLKTCVSLSISMQINSSATSGGSHDEQICKCQSNELLNISPVLTPKIIKLIVLLINSLGGGCSLEDILKPLLLEDRNGSLFLNLIIPLCFCIMSEAPILPNAKDRDGKVKWKLRLEDRDVVFLLNLCTNELLGKSKNVTESLSQLFRASSPISYRKNNIQQKVLLLALKVVITCFRTQLHGEWYSLASNIKEIALRNLGGLPFWNFMIFIMKFQSPLIMHLKGFVRRKILERNVDTVEEMEKKRVLEELLNSSKYERVNFSLMVGYFVNEAVSLKAQFNAKNENGASESTVSPRRRSSSKSCSKSHEDSKFRSSSFRHSTNSQQSSKVQSPRFKPSPSHEDFTKTAKQLVARVRSNPMSSSIYQKRKASAVPSITVQTCDRCPDDSPTCKLKLGINCSGSSLKEDQVSNSEQEPFLSRFSDFSQEEEEEETRVRVKRGMSLRRNKTISPKRNHSKVTSPGSESSRNDSFRSLKLKVTS